MATTKKRTTRSPAKTSKRSPKNGRKIFGIVLTVLLVLALAIAVVVIVYFATDGFGKKKTADITVAYLGKTYEQDTRGVILFSGCELEISSKVAPDETLTLRIYASDETDFRFTLDEEPWKWSQMKGRDFTKGFSIERTEKGVKIYYDSLEEVVGAVQDTNVTLLETPDPRSDLFTLVIEGTESGTLSLHFRLGVPASELEFPSNIIV